MSYVDEVYENVVDKNPNEPEFHQAVKEVLDSLRPVIDANEEMIELYKNLCEDGETLYVFYDKEKKTIHWYNKYRN